MDLTNKKILITHTLIADYMGSTVVCLQVAKELLRLGADVTVISSSFAPPMDLAFEDAGIEVTLEAEAELDIFDYDFVWVHSQLLPISFIDQIEEGAQGQDKVLPAFIFNHMSAIDAAPDEHPYIPLLEETIASVEAFVSEESRDTLSSFYDKKTNDGISQVIFANPAPKEFADFGVASVSSTDNPADDQVGVKLISKTPIHNGNAEEHPMRIAIISNHIPDEVLDAKEILESAGKAEIDIIGAQGTPGDVTPALIASYDAIMTIGKTVQYCLIMGTPVYVYDHFGGFGYLSADNLDRAAYANFSGRGGEILGAEQIAKDLIDGRDKALRFVIEHEDEFELRYDMSTRLMEIFDLAKPRESITLPYEGYAEQIKAQMRFAWRYYRAWDYEIWSNRERARLDGACVSKEEEIERQVARKAILGAELASTRSELDAALEGMEARQACIEDLRRDIEVQGNTISYLHSEIDEMRESTTWKVGRIITAPARWLKDRLQALLHR